jgi:hypothetical protein
LRREESDLSGPNQDDGGVLVSIRGPELSAPAAVHPVNAVYFLFHKGTFRSGVS